MIKMFRIKCQAAKTVMAVCLLVLLSCAESTMRWLGRGSLSVGQTVTRARLVRALKVGLPAYLRIAVPFLLASLTAVVVSFLASTGRAVPTELVAMLLALAAKGAAVAWYVAYLQRELRAIIAGR